jgi:hypothetical protein
MKAKEWTNAEQGGSSERAMHLILGRHLRPCLHGRRSTEKGKDAVDQLPDAEVARRSRRDCMWTFMVPRFPSK